MLIFCRGLAVVYITVNAGDVNYVMVCCQDDVFLMQRRSWNA